MATLVAGGYGVTLPSGAAFALEANSSPPTIAREITAVFMTELLRGLTCINPKIRPMFPVYVRFRKPELCVSDRDAYIMARSRSSEPELRAAPACSAATPPSFDQRNFRFVVAGFHH